MATYTSKLNLKKPEGNELFNRVQDLNDNWDKIDVHDHDDKVDKETGKSLVSDATILDLTDGNETTLHKHSASNTPFTPTGSLSSTNVQNALAELDSEKIAKTEVYSLLNQDRRIFGVSWTVGQNSPIGVRTHDAVGLTANVGIDNQVVVNDFDNLPIWGQMKEVTDLFGNVFIRIPKFYIKKGDEITTDFLQISQYKHDGFYLPWSFWDFTNSKELDYVDIGKHQASLDSSNRLESKPLKYPLVNTNIVNFRTYARNNGAGYGQLDLHSADICQALFRVEFATKNSQSILVGFTNGNYTATRLAVLTETAVNRVVLANANADVFRVGQPISIGTSQGGNQVFYGRTITAINVVDASNKELVFDGDPVNITAGNMVYNTGWRSGWSSAVLAKSGTIIANDGFYPMMYRGIESLYGDVWKWVDGVNITERQAWVCENQDSYVSNLFTAPYKMLSYVNALTDGYPKRMGIDFANPYANFPVEHGGATTTFYSDYYYQNTGQRVARLGGAWNDGANAGLFFWTLDAASSHAGIGFGGRLIRKAV